MEESLYAVPLRAAISLLLLQLGLINVEHCFGAMDPGVGWISRISKWVFFLPMLIWSICMVKREPEIWTSNCFAQLLLTLIRPIMVCGWTKCLSKKLVQPMVCVAIDNNVVLRPTKSPVDQNVDQSLFHSPVKLRFAFGQFISFDLACALPLQCLYFSFTSL